MVKLEEVCEILDSMRVPVTASERENGIYPYYGANGVQDFVSDYIFDDELVLLAEDGGNFGSKTKPIAYRVSGKCWVNNHAHVLKAKPSIDTDYLCYSIMFYDVSKIISGTTRAKLNQAAMRKMLILLPSLEIQKQIAKTLGTVSELLAMHKQQLAELDNLIKSIFYDMFGDPVTNEKGWDKETLRNLSIKFSDGPFGSNLKTCHYENSGVRVIRLNNIGVNHFINTDKVFISQKYFEESLMKYACFPGDVVIGTLGDPNIRACIIPAHIKSAINKADCILCRPNQKKVLSEYIAGIINLPNFILLISSLFHGQTRTRVSMGQLATIQIPLPPLNLQTQFAEIVTRIEEQKALVQKAIDETQYLFDSLMSEYFDE